MAELNFHNTPYSEESGTTPGKMARGVSIIGAGITPVGLILERDELKNMSDHELAAWAAQMAMEDAGVTSRDIDAWSLAEVANPFYSTNVAPNVVLSEWVGMRGKPSSHHEEACCSSYCAFKEAVGLISSGIHDMVMIVGVDTDRDFCDATKLPYQRHPGSEYVPSANLGGPEFMAFEQTDPGYSRWNGTYYAWADENINLYMKKTGITREQAVQAIDGVAISMRHNAAHNPKAFIRQEIADEAKENGYDSVEAYMRSEANWYWSPMHQRLHILNHIDGGGAMILCASDIAKRYNPKPIDILGIGVSTMDCRQPNFMTRFREECYRQAFAQSGIDPSEIDIMYSTDFTAGHVLQDAEMAGYVPEGEAWKYAINGEFGFDGSKPFNTQGGSIGFGHAFGIHIFEQAVECVEQMRGQCGDRQVKKLPKTAFISGYGDAQEGCAFVLRTQE